MFGKRLLIIFGPKRGDVTGGWRKLHNACRIYSGKIEGNVSLAKCRRRGVDYNTILKCIAEKYGVRIRRSRE